MINQSRNGWNPDQCILKWLMKNNRTSSLSQKLKFFLNRSQLDSIKRKLPAPSFSSSPLYFPPFFFPFFPIKVFLGFNEWPTTVIKNWIPIGRSYMYTHMCSLYLISKMVSCYIYFKFRNKMCTLVYTFFVFLLKS